MQLMAQAESGDSCKNIFACSEGGGLISRSYDFDVCESEEKPNSVYYVSSVYSEGELSSKKVHKPNEIKVVYKPGISLFAEWYRNEHANDVIDVKLLNKELVGSISILAYNSHFNLENSAETPLFYSYCEFEAP